jgi:hypothetical protein
MSMTARLNFQPLCPTEAPTALTTTGAAAPTGVAVSAVATGAGFATEAAPLATTEW